MKPTRVVVGLALVIAGLLAVWWWRRDRGQPAATPTAVVQPTTGDAAHRPPPPSGAGDREAPLPVLIDDDPRGELRLEGQVLDASERPVAGAVVVLELDPAAHRDDRGRRWLRVRCAGRAAVHGGRARGGRDRRSGDHAPDRQERSGRAPPAARRQGHRLRGRHRRQADRQGDRRAARYRLRSATPPTRRARRRFRPWSRAATRSPRGRTAWRTRSRGCRSAPATTRSS